MRLAISQDTIEIRLSWWEKVLGLMRDIRIPRASIGDVSVEDEPLRAIRGTGLKAGLRLPGLIYVCRSIKLDRAWIVRRGVPALTFAVHDGGPLTHVSVSTPEAADLARRLRGG